MSMKFKPVIVRQEWVLLSEVDETTSETIVSKGPHTLIISGLVAFLVYGNQDDDYTDTDAFTIDVGPSWDPTKPLQASTMTSFGDIASWDSDDVDHSKWAVESETGHVEKVIAGTGNIQKQLRLLIMTTTQGEDNTWKAVSFHTVANGTLLNVDNVLRNIRVTQQLPELNPWENNESHDRYWTELMIREAKKRIGSGG